MPSAQILGPSRSEVPIAYWSHSFPPEIMRQETKIAVESGFRAHKFKRRAHTDVIDQVESICEVCPEGYDIKLMLTVLLEPLNELSKLVDNCKNTRR